jgi:hypothetical protein
MNSAGSFAGGFGVEKRREMAWRVDRVGFSHKIERIEKYLRKEKMEGRILLKT